MFQVQLEEKRGRDPKLKIAKSKSAVARVTAKTCSKVQKIKSSQLQHVAKQLQSIVTKLLPSCQPS